MPTLAMLALAAHPGHGTTPGDSIAHHVTEPGHGALVLTLACLVVCCAVYLVASYVGGRK